MWEVIGVSDFIMFAILLGSLGALWLLLRWCDRQVETEQ